MKLAIMIMTWRIKKIGESKFYFEYRWWFLRERERFVYVYFYFQRWYLRKIPEKSIWPCPCTHLLPNLVPKKKIPIPISAPWPCNSENSIVGIATQVLSQNQNCNWLKWSRRPQTESNLFLLSGFLQNSAFFGHQERGRQTEMDFQVDKATTGWDFFRHKEITALVASHHGEEVEVCTTLIQGKKYEWQFVFSIFG